MDELITVGKEKDVSIGSAALTMAIGILVDRIGRLTPDDPLFELAKGLGAATCDEDVEAIRVAMREILDQSRGGVQAANLDDVVRPDKLKRWTDFVSARVASLRAKSGMTQVELEKKTGLPQSHISRIESGKLSPTRATLEKLATAFGVSLNQLDPSAQADAAPRQGVTVWSFHGICLEAPETMTLELWQKLNNYVNVLKPGGGE